MLLFRELHLKYWYSRIAFLTLWHNPWNVCYKCWRTCANPPAFCGMVQAYKLQLNSEVPTRGGALFPIRVPVRKISHCKNRWHTRGFMHLQHRGLSKPRTLIFWGTTIISRGMVLFNIYVHNLESTGVNPLNFWGCIQSLAKCCRAYQKLKRLCIISFSYRVSTIVPSDLRKKSWYDTFVTSETNGNLAQSEIQWIRWKNALFALISLQPG